MLLLLFLCRDQLDDSSECGMGEGEVSSDVLVRTDVFVNYAAI